MCLPAAVRAGNCAALRPPVAHPSRPSASYTLLPSRVHRCTWTVVAQTSSYIPPSPLPGVPVSRYNDFQ